MEEDVKGLAKIFYSHTLSHLLIDLKRRPASRFLRTGPLTIFAPSLPDLMLNIGLRHVVYNTPAFT